MPIIDLPVEVFSSILDFLESPDLLSCALVCKRWTSLAVDVRWTKRKPNFLELMEMIGPIERIWSQQDVAWQYAFSNRLMVQERLGSKGWSLLNGIRRKITYLSISQCISPGDLNYIIGLQNAAESASNLAAFFPNLNHLFVETYNLPIPFQFHLFAGERLRQLEIRWWAASHQSIDESMMRWFVERSPHLECISVRAPISLDGLHAFKDLRELDCICPISIDSAIQILRNCTRLESVSLSGLQRAGDPQAKATNHGSMVPISSILRRLTVQAQRDQEGTLPLQLLEVLLTTEMPALEELDVHSTSASPDRWRKLLQLLSKRAPHLAKLSLVTDSNDADWSHLGEFRELQEVKIWAEYDTFTSGAIRVIVDHNPRMQRLELRKNHLGRSLSPLDLQFLEWVATRCKCLRYLAMPLDARAIQWDTDPPSPTARFDHLTSLHMEVHIPQNARAISPFATYLAKLCPHVKRLDARLQYSLNETDGYQTAEEVDSWEAVDDLFWKALESNTVVEHLHESTI